MPHSTRATSCRWLPCSPRPSRASALSTERRDDVAIIRIDAPDAAVNTLSPAVAAEFEAVFNQIDQDRQLRGVVIVSGKSDSFIAGADVEQFARFKGPGDAAH